MNTLKKLRKKHNVTQKDVADGVGLATTTIASYEQGHRNIGVPVAKKLGEYFNVQWTIFFENEVLETYDNNNQASDQTRLA